MKPVLDGNASSVEVTAKAERDYVYWMQDALSQRVWNAGCASVSLQHLHMCLVSLHSDFNILVVYKREEVELHVLPVDSRSLLVA